MHSRSKAGAQAVSAEEAAGRAAQVRKYVQAKDLFLQRRRAGVMDDKSRELTARLIALNPDLYPLWNFRREMYIHSSRQHPERSAALCAEELQLAEKGLERNPKCYAAWHHRLWVLERGHSDLQHELSLCSLMLNKDARNFLCWNHRRAVAAIAGTPPRDELAFTTEKIRQDFSNYSAWQYRSALIPRIFPAPTVDYWQCIDEEFALVRNAFFTDPRDQSCWLYHRWLLSRVVAQLPQMPSLLIALGQADAQQASSPSAAPACSAPVAPLAVFDRELAMCRELDAVEANCKWTLLTIALLLAGREAVSQAQQQQLEQEQQSAAAASVTTAACTLPAGIVTELAGLFQRLIALDPMRTAYYRDVHRSLTCTASIPSA